MILTLPKKFNNATEDIFIPAEEPLFKITLIVGGILLYNISGVLIAQIFAKDNVATAAVADGASLKIEKTANDYVISQIELPSAEKKKLTRPASERVLKSEYILFGKPLLGRYQIFEKKPTDNKPSVAATVITVPLNDKFIKIKIEEDSNILRLLSIVLSIALL
ncbi:hypothetical protein EOM82_04305 [bacterium]|nr:hypothetical protein [bacterium]